MVHRRSIGRYQLFERNPRIPGRKKYLVVWPDGDMEFSRYGKAVRWAKDRRNKEASCQLQSAPAAP